MAAASAALQAISAFVGRPNGLAALLEAVNAKLDLILQQLVNVEDALAKLAVAIAELKNEIPVFVAEELAKANLFEVMGLFKAFAAQKIETRRQFLASSDQELLKMAAFQITAKLDALFLNSHPTSPEIAIMTPAILGLHVNVLAIVFPDQARVALDSHIDWHTKILDPDRVKSVAWWVQQLRRDRETLLDKIGNNELAKWVGFKGYIRDGAFRDRRSMPFAETICSYPMDFSVPRRPYPYTPVAATMYGEFTFLESPPFPVMGLRTVVTSSKGPPQVTHPTVAPAKGPDWYEKLEPWPRPSASGCKGDELNVPNQLVALSEAKTRKLWDDVIDRNREPLFGNERSIGMIPTLNDLSAKIYYLEQVQMLVERTRSEALEMKRSIG